MTKLQQPVFDILQAWGAHEITIEKDIPALLKKATKAVEFNSDPMAYAKWIALNSLHLTLQEEIEPTSGEEEH